MVEEFIDPWQDVKAKRGICRPFMETLRTERDATQEAIDFLDEVLEQAPERDRLPSDTFIHTRAHNGTGARARRVGRTEHLRGPVGRPMTKTTLATLLATLLTILPAAATMAQDEDDVLYGLVNDLGAALVDVGSELSAIDERQSSDQWMVFDSASQGLVQVDLAELGRWLPVVLTLRASPAGASRLAGDIHAPVVAGIGAARRRT